MPLRWNGNTSISIDCIGAIREAGTRRGRRDRYPQQLFRSLKHPLDKHLYAQRHLVECRFGKLKQFRRVTTCYEKTARNYLAIVTIAATLPWLR